MLSTLGIKEFNHDQLPNLYQQTLRAMTPIRETVYAYMQLPTHKKIQIQREYGCYLSEFNEHVSNKKLFKHIKKENKLDELREKLGLPAVQEPKVEEQNEKAIQAIKKYIDYPEYADIRHALLDCIKKIEKSEPKAYGRGTRFKRRNT